VLPAVAILLAIGGPTLSAEPAGLIFDTDLCGDCGDVLALGMVHALESRGACRLLAVTISTDHELAAPFTSAVNTFYGRGRVPIGAVGAGGVKATSPFLSLVEKTDGGKLCFPHELQPGRGARPATAVLREVLAAEPDHSVVVVQVGFATNLARLLSSPPDERCPLGGEELLRRKVRFLSVMAGAFRPIERNPHYREYNVTQDIPSAQHLAQRWPTPVVWSGFEVGASLLYPSARIAHDYGYVAHHPLAEAYRLANPPARNQPTWDLTAVLEAAYPDRAYFDHSLDGTVTIDPDGFTRFTAGPSGRHRYLILEPARRERALEALVQLASQPPQCATNHQ
jgi:inosine-uridine nucleoside N-ribohydrolase